LLSNQNLQNPQFMQKQNQQIPMTTIASNNNPFQTKQLNGMSLGLRHPHNPAQAIFDYTPQQKDLSQLTSSPPDPNLTRLLQASDWQPTTTPKPCGTESSLTDYTPASALQHPLNRQAPPMQPPLNESDYSSTSSSSECT